MSAIPEQKVLRVTYTINEEFHIPSWIDLENNEQVDHYYVRYNILYIMLVGADEPIKINSKGYIEQYDYNCPDEDSESIFDESGQEYRCDECEEEYDQDKLQFVLGKTLCRCCMNEPVKEKEIIIEKKVVEEPIEPIKPLIIKPSDEEMDKLIEQVYSGKKETEIKKVYCRILKTLEKKYFYSVDTGAIYDPETRECIGLYKSPTEYRLDLEEYYNTNYEEIKW